MEWSRGLCHPPPPLRLISSPQRTQNYRNKFTLPLQPSLPSRCCRCHQDKFAPPSLLLLPYLCCGLWRLATDIATILSMLLLLPPRQVCAIAVSISVAIAVVLLPPLLPSLCCRYCQAKFALSLLIFLMSCCHISTALPPAAKPSLRPCRLCHCRFHLAAILLPSCFRQKSKKVPPSSTSFPSCCCCRCCLAPAVAAVSFLTLTSCCHPTAVADISISPPQLLLSHCCLCQQSKSAPPPLLLLPSCCHLAAALPHQ